MFNKIRLYRNLKHAHFNILIHRHPISSLNDRKLFSATFGQKNVNPKISQNFENVLQTDIIQKKKLKKTLGIAYRNFALGLAKKVA